MVNQFEPGSTAASVSPLPIRDQKRKNTGEGGDATGKLGAAKKPIGGLLRILNS